MNKIKAGEKKVIPFSVFISKHCNWVVRRDKFGWTTNIPEWDGIYTTEELYDIFVNYEQQPSTGMRDPDLIHDLIEYFESRADVDGDSEGYHPNEEMQFSARLSLFRIELNKAKWSDSDVKKFLEDYRVANREIYLNPEIWFDKLNEKK